MNELSPVYIKFQKKTFLSKSVDESFILNFRNKNTMPPGRCNSWQAWHGIFKTVFEVDSIVMLDQVSGPFIILNVKEFPYFVEIFGVWVKRNN